MAGGATLRDRDSGAGRSSYRPRRARDSPLYRLAETHHDTFKQVDDERFAQRYGAWRSVIERTLFAFLDCGECKRADAPRLTPSIRIAIDDLDLKRVIIVYPGSRRFALADRVEAVPLERLADPGRLFWDVG